MRTIEIELPDFVEIAGADDAPESVKSVKTDKWEPDFCLTALTQGVSLKIRNTWSVSKKDVTKTQATHAAMEKGEWYIRERTGESQVKFQEKVAKLSVVDLAALLSPEQQASLLAALQPMKSE